MRILIITFLLLSSGGGLLFMMNDKPIEKKLPKVNKSNLKAIDYLDHINDKELNLSATKEIFNKMNENINSRKRLKAIYVLSDLVSKTKITDASLNYIDSLPQRIFPQFKLGMIYFDMGKKSKARECWRKSSHELSELYIARSYISEFKYDKALKFLLQQDLNQMNFQSLNLLYSLHFIKADKTSLKTILEHVSQRFPENKEWQLKVALMNFIGGDYHKVQEIIAPMIFSKELEVSELACAYNARMYLFISRLISQPKNTYIDDILMAAKQDCQAIFDISGRSQYFRLFIDQKTIEKEIVFYQNFISSQKDSNTLFPTPSSSHLVSRYLSSRYYISKKQFSAASNSIKAAEFNRHIEQIEGLHLGFLNSPLYLFNNAQILTLEGQHLSALKVIEQLHQNSISDASINLYQFNRQELGKPSSTSLTTLFTKNNSLTPMLHLNKKFEEAINDGNIHSALEIIQKASISKQEKEFISACLIRKNDPTKAKQVFTRLGAAGLPQALIELALIDYEQGQINTSKNSLKKALLFSSTRKSALLLLARLAAENKEFKKMEEILIPLRKEKDLQALLILASKALELKLFPQALKYSQEVIMSYGNRKAPLLIKAAAVMDIYSKLPTSENKALLRQTVQQIEKLQIARDQAIHRALTELYFHLNDLKQAQEYMVKVDDPQLHKKIISSQLKQNMAASQIESWQKLLTLHGDKFTDLELLRFESLRLIKNNKYSEALQKINHLTDRKTLTYKIICLHQMKDFDKRNQLISQCDQALQNWRILGDISFREQQYDQAAECYKQALALQPSNIIISNNYISAILELPNAQFSTVLIHAESNYQKLPQTQTLDTLIKVLSRLEKWEKLQKLLEQQDSLSISNQLMLAKIYESSSLKKTEEILTRLLTDRTLVWHNNQKDEVLQWLRHCSQNH
ncbi:tetratricopeptide repeat protein [Lentisphaera profundi]|uniref:Tetratricopeptide repeat protein n=1 Tax=Lentisphaera profundi TaxID=1658616 RepID=A0ABY7W2N7_9BACT|nr:tetratricopeptide repeat protein [Lentisphaera profundi]WDE98548.1 tetratricopeptide repeat protein [Lentisphaera profundi]